MSFLQQSYDRIASLSVFQTAEIPVGPTGFSLQNVDPIGLTFPSKMADGTPAYRIKFHVEYSSGPNPTPNPSTVSIYNLGETSRKAFRFNDTLLLKAGYGTSAKTLFQGQISKAVTRKEGPDYVTEIQASDGKFAHQNSLINTSFAQATSANQVLNTLQNAAQAAGLTPGLIDPTAVAKLSTKTYNNGIVLSGKTMDRLAEFCNSNGINWNIEKGKLNFVSYGNALQKPVITLTPDTGLIGIPEQRAVDVNAASLISFKCLLNPELGMFQLVLLTSKFVNGLYITAKITHTGDTFGLDWYTECEAT